MPIDLGLSRVARLLGHLNNPHLHGFKSIHIAGTNGKGSTITYLTSILTRANIRNGRFVSPHMLYYNDSVCINNEVYPLKKFKNVSKLVMEQNQQHKLGCTEFELLTVTAFKIFELENVDVAVIEVGLGGRLDATNVLEPFRNGGGVLATGITKIGMDHESLLGNTLGEIAFEKAGIMKAGIPCVVDRSNDKEVLDVIKAKSEEMEAPLWFADGLDSSTPPLVDMEEFNDIYKLSPLHGDYQKQNLSIALTILRILNRKHFGDKLTTQIMSEGIKQTKWHGRLQHLDIPNYNLSILLDGAHNESAAIELDKYLTQTYRDDTKGIIFIIALTKGKSALNLLKHITRKSDTIIFTTFTQPDKMPWISSTDPKELQEVGKEYVNDIHCMENADISETLNYVGLLRLKGDSRPIVACGSLYLCSDILRTNI